MHGPAATAPSPETPVYMEVTPDPAKGVTGIFKLSYDTLTEENAKTLVETLKGYVDSPDTDIKVAVADRCVFVKKNTASKRPVPATLVKESTVTSGSPPKLLKLTTGKGASLDPAWEQIVRRF